MKTTKTHSKTSFIIGVLAPLIFVLTFILDGFFQKGYSSISMHISALSIGTMGWLQIGNFMVFGILLFIFSTGLLKESLKHKTSNVGPIVLIISSGCFLLSGPFVMDPMGTPRENITLHGTIHGILGGIVFLLMPITCFIFYHSLKKEENGVPFARLTLFAGVFISIALVLFTLATKVESLHQRLLHYQGLLQRTVLIPYMIWLFSFALKKQDPKV